MCSLRRRKLIFEYIYIRRVKLKTSSWQNTKFKLSFCAVTCNITSLRHYLFVDFSMCGNTPERRAILTFSFSVLFVCIVQ